MKILLYIDPGLGSMIIQVIIGAVAACSAAFYMFRQKIAKLFGHSAKDNVVEEVETKKEEQEELLNGK